MNDLEGVLREHIIYDSRNLDSLAPQEAHASCRIMRTYHTHFGILLGSIPLAGWWDERSLRLSGHNLQVETQRHQGNKCPYEFRTCNKCDWHTVQDEEHVILDCPSQDLTELRTQFQHLFSSAPPSSAARHRDFTNQAGVLGLAKFVSACLKYFRHFSINAVTELLVMLLDWAGLAPLASAKMPL
eukprot:1149221-Pelagomonas_calceolata.AAC.1